MWGLFFLAAPVTAHIVAAYGAQWSPGIFITVFVLMNIFGLGLLYSWVADPVQSSLAREGLLPIPGALNYLSMTLAFTIVFMFYLGTLKVDKGEVWPITAVLAMSVALGMLQPPYAVHGSIHAQAWAVTIGGWVALVAGAVYLHRL